jgi:type VI protein secretion system component VasK
VAAVWVAALATLLVLDVLARTRDRMDRWFAGLVLPLVLLLFLSIAVDRWARPQAASASAPRPAANSLLSLPGHGYAR